MSAGDSRRAARSGPRPLARGEVDVRPEHVKGIARNATLLLLAYVLPRVFTFGSVVLAARVLGAEQFGAYGTAAAFAVVLSILSSLGMLPLLVRDIARDRSAAPRLLRAAHVVKTLAGAVMFAALLALSAALDYSPQVTASALLLGLGYWFVSYADNLSAYFQGVERMRACTEASAAFGLVSGALGALLVVLTGSIVWFSAAFAIGQAAALSWLLLRLPAEVRAGEPARTGDVVRLIRTMLPFTAAFIALTVHYKVDVLILERLRTAAEVGHYTAAYKFVDVFHALVLVGVAAIFPRLSRSTPAPGAGPGPERRRYAAARAAELVLLVAVPVAGGLWMLREPAIGTLFGAAYADSARMLAYLALALPALALNLYGGYVLGAVRRMGWMAALYACGLAFKVALQLLLVPRSGALGTAAAVLGAEALVAVAFCVVLARAAQAAPRPRPLALAAGAGALAWGTSTLLAPAGPAWAALAYAAGVAALYALGGAISVTERRAIRGAMAFRRGEVPEGAS
jgi:O-antigen/teichoic acid export membrane protein